MNQHLNVEWICKETKDAEERLATAFDILFENIGDAEVQDNNSNVVSLTASHKRHIMVHNGSKDRQTRVSNVGRSSPTNGRQHSDHQGVEQQGKAQSNASSHEQLPPLQEGGH